MTVRMCYMSIRRFHAFIHQGPDGEIKNNCIELTPHIFALVQYIARIMNPDHFILYKQNC